MSRGARRAGALLLLVAGCGGESKDSAPVYAAAPSEGSQSVMASADGVAVYAVNVDEGTVARFDVASGAVQLVEVGAEPTRLTQAGDHILVTLRDERAIVVLQDQGGVLQVVDRVGTGAEPVAIVATGDGTRIYVALSLQDEVDELDASLNVLRRFSVPNHPSWLAVHPSGDTLYVSACLGGALSYLDLTADDPVPEAVDVPAVIGTGPDRTQPYSRRMSGDPSFSPDGREIAVPALWVDNVTASHGGNGDTEERYDAIGLGVSPNNPGLVRVAVDDAGRPEADGVSLLLAVGAGWVAPANDVQVVRSFIDSVRYSPDGSAFLVAMEGSQVVGVFRADPDAMTEVDAGFLRAPNVFVSTGEGPSGVAFTDADHAWVHTWLDRSLADLDFASVRERLDAQPATDEPTPETLLARAPVVLTAPALAPDVDLGRRLFSSAVVRIMGIPAVGVTCSTCHFEGRNDGLTWTFEDRIRQTISLAGPKAETAPFTWTQGVATLPEEAAISIERTGGTGATDADLQAVASFIDSTRDVDTPEKGAVSDAVARGAVLFARADVGCAACHNGSRYTDLSTHDLYGLTGVDTPTLVGIAATAPYLHDGTAPTLRAVLETARTGAMGDTSMLSDEELDDLEAYLRSL